MKRRGIALILMVWMLLSSWPIVLPVSAEQPELWDGSVADGFAGGSGTADDPYRIETAAQLAFLARSVNAGESYNDKHLRLTADIRLNDESFTFDADTGLVQVTDKKHTAYFGTGIAGDTDGDNTQFDENGSEPGAFYNQNYTKSAKMEYVGVLNEWEPIGQNAVRCFAGNFDGGGHTVYGVYVNKESWAGLFGFADSGVISNIKVCNGLVLGTNYTAGIAGQSTVSNCESDAYVIGNKQAGGIVGAGEAVLCKASGIVSAGNEAGGIMTTGSAAYCENNARVYSASAAGGILVSGSAVYCRNTGKVTGESHNVGGVVATGDAFYCYNAGNVSGANNVGGIVAMGNTSYCHNIGGVSGANNVGGIMGQMTSATITYCRNEGSVTGKYYSGGVVGRGSASYCSNTASVFGDYSVGGIAGDGVALYCYNTGDVSGSDRARYLGGIVGSGNGNEENSSVAYCYNTGNVSGYECMGGIAGRNPGIDISNCYNTGDVSGKFSAGGIVGGCEEYPITNCYTTGNVSGYSSVGGVAGDKETISDSIQNVYYIIGSANDKYCKQHGVGNSEAGKVKSDIAGTTVGITLEDAKRQDTFPFDFEADWQLGATYGYEYPTLKGLHHGDHVFDRQTVSDTLRYAPANCQSGAIYYYSCACGNITDKTFMHGDPVHTVLSYAWLSDEVGHWHVCALCEEKLNLCDHTFEKSDVTETPNDDKKEIVVKCTECKKEVTLSWADQNEKTSFMQKNSALFTAIFLGVGAVLGGLGVYGFVVVRAAVRKKK